MGSSSCTAAAEPRETNIKVTAENLQVSARNIRFETRGRGLGPKCYPALKYRLRRLNL